ncbi:hypothetical protein C8J57DRAFT_1586152 [Mycena rebaudengoi]|nr:hypothetical protein C8J57DRAFT_1649531 [Mycena rebaudengoi]KAJ7290935.1 hypothetical protein C8J57DRAFT_1586152 [Mycena rebaudengoi]
MDSLPSQLLSFMLISVTTFIPNDSLRYFALASTLLSLGGYAVFANNLSSQAARCETVMQEIEALFITITKECARDLCFITEVGLQLSLAKQSLSELRMRILLTSEITWMAYPLHLRIILLSITECRRNFEELRSSMQVALERARQQVYIEDINHRRRALVAFGGEQADMGQGFRLRMRSSSRANSHEFRTSVVFIPRNTGAELVSVYEG